MNLIRLHKLLNLSTKMDEIQGQALVIDINSDGRLEVVAAAIPQTPYPFIE